MDIELQEKRNRKKVIGLFAKLLLVLVILFLFCFVVVMPQYRYNNQAAMVDKVARLKSIKDPKIRLVGNSNLAFGIQSKKIEEAFGMPVINLGLHGGVGNAFNEQAAKINVQEGDIIILSPSSFSDNDRIKNPELAWITIENNKSMYSFIRAKDISDMALAYPTYLKKCIQLWSHGIGNLDTDPIYSRNQYNEYGDNIYPREKSTSDLDLSFVAVQPIGELYVNRVNELNRMLKEQGATLLLAAYPIAYHDEAPAKEEYAAFQRELEEKLDFPIISDYTEYCLNPSLFYNTYLHLTDEGVAVRTELLIKDLKNYLENKQE